MAELTVYSSNGCKNCTLVKTFIKVNGGQVIEKNIDENAEFKKEWEAFDVLGAPVTTYGKLVLLGWNEEVRLQLADILGV